MCIGVATFVLLASLAIAGDSRGSEKRPPIIDVHVHVYGEDARWTYRVPNPASGQPMTATNEEAHMRATLAEMEKYNVVKAVISNYHDVVQRWHTVAPEKFVTSFGFSNPKSVDLGFIREEHDAGRLLALGEITSQYDGLAPNDPELEPVFALAEELDIPIGIHVGLTKPGGIYDAFPDYRARVGDPLLLEDVLVRHPRLRLYVMHAGWPMLDNMIALLWAHPQVYVDISVIDWALPRAEFHSYLQRLIEAGFGKRIMFGSDQMVWPDAIGMAIEGVESAIFLTDSQRRDIFYNNAVDFFQLGEE
jgi:hypothetical protein